MKSVEFPEPMDGIQGAYPAVDTANCGFYAGCLSIFGNLATLAGPGFRDSGEDLASITLLK